MLLALASLLDETELLFRPSLECMMEKTSLSGPSVAFKVASSCFKAFSKDTLKLLFVDLPPAISSLSSLLFHFFIFFPLKISVVLVLTSGKRRTLWLNLKQNKQKKGRNVSFLGLFAAFRKGGDDILAVIRHLQDSLQPSAAFISVPRVLLQNKLFVKPRRCLWLSELH